jgi:hypothetical protein
MPDNPSVHDDVVTWIGGARALLARLERTMILVGGSAPATRRTG